MPELFDPSSHRSRSPAPASRFQTRRSLTRARASKERMNRQTLLERNHRRQSRFARNLRRIALLLLALGSIGAVVHALWIAPRLSGQKAREALDIRLPAQR